MLRIAIDGACRRNGKPDCVSSGGALVLSIDGETVTGADTLCTHEIGSTNQRGELQALLYALSYVNVANVDAQIITDSEYIFNAMTKQWFNSWEANGWLNAAGEPVKNADLWRLILGVVNSCRHLDITYYHIKGHCIPFGKATANKLLCADQSGLQLMHAIYEKYDEVKDKKIDNLNAAQELSMKNNGFKLPDEILRDFVVMNAVADAVATKEVEFADREI